MTRIPYASGSGAGVAEGRLQTMCAEIAEKRGLAGMSIQKSELMGHESRVTAIARLCSAASANGVMWPRPKAVAGMWGSGQAGRALAVSTDKSCLKSVELQQLLSSLFKLELMEVMYGLYYVL